MFVAGGILRQSSNDRYRLEQIIYSEWLEGTTPNGPCESWSMLPTFGEEDVELSTIEKAAREKLEGLGITSDMLKEQSSQGARSAVIAAYRIVVHCLQNIAQLPPIAPPQKPPKSRTCAIL